MNYGNTFNTTAAKDYLAQELLRFFINDPSMASVLGRVGMEERQVKQNIWVLRFANADDSFVLKLYFEGAYDQYEPQIRVESLMLRGELKGKGMSKKIINFLVDYCKDHRPTTLWLIDVINRGWKQYLISQGARLVQEETREAGAVLYIPEKIGLKKRRIYNDEFDRELIQYLVQFLTMESIRINDIRSTKVSETVYDIQFAIDGFVLKFQYEKAGSAGEAQIRFELRMGQSEEQTMPVSMLVNVLENMLNVLLLYCRVHGKMTLWMFNGQVFGSDFVNYFVQKGAKVMRDDLTGLYGGTVLGFDRKLQ